MPSISFSFLSTLHLISKGIIKLYGIIGTSYLVLYTNVIGLPVNVEFDQNISIFPV